MAGHQQDYMEATEIQNCIVLNRPLYYYICTTRTFLMSHFGTVENEYEYSRFKQSLRLCEGKCKEEILSFIENVIQNGKANRYY